MGDSLILSAIISFIVAILVTGIRSWWDSRKEKVNILKSLLNEIDINLTDAGNIVTIIRADVYHPLPIFKNSVWNMGLSKALNPKEFKITSCAYYKLDLINSKIKNREEYNKFWLVGQIPKENQINTEKAIVFDITNEKNGLIVLLEKAREEVENIKKKKFSLKPGSI